MARAADLSGFLRSRRAALTPAEVGLPRNSNARRVQGLRREEIAMLAGVSVDYYTRLEQGRAPNVSAQVLSAVADALRLDGMERRHLFDMAQPGTAPVQPTKIGPRKARPAMRMMMDALDPTPAVLHGPCLEVVAINRMGKVLFDDFDAMPPGERNTARWMFLNPRARVVFPDWEEIGSQMAAILRLTAGRVSVGPPEHRASMARLVDDLCSRSEEFARVWAEHRIFQHTHGTKRFRHEAVGIMMINYESLIPPADPGLTLTLYTADTGSPSEEKLRALADWAANRDAAAGAGSENRPAR
ncbi:helix-turn-helix transcriptional regulator [Actinomadura craniellae]|nr:helix-turn-helix transcriptional regulator [Actinomadura craniellae]